MWLFCFQRVLLGPQILIHFKKMQVSLSIHCTIWLSTFFCSTIVVQDYPTFVESPKLPNLTKRVQKKPNKCDSATNFFHRRCIFHHFDEASGIWSLVHLLPPPEYRRKDSGSNGGKKFCLFCLREKSCRQKSFRKKCIQSKSNCHSDRWFLLGKKILGVKGEIAL